MEIKEILSRVDHTLLKPDASWREIKTVLDDAVLFGAASACIPASFVSRAKGYVGDTLPICTVIGFPNGYSTSLAKAFEAEDAVKNGADEVDMVINIGALKEKDSSAVLGDIKEVRRAVPGKILKVIVETCLLTEDEKKAVCGIVSESGADFIKTSTGFSRGGATFEDIALFAKYVAPGVRIKAAGGISSFEDAEKFISLGASRLGTSRLVKLAKGS